MRATPSCWLVVGAFGVVWVFELLELPPAEVAAVKGIGKVQMAAIRGIAKRAAAESGSD